MSDADEAEEDWKNVWRVVKLVAGDAEHSVAIGGVAVYLQSKAIRDIEPEYTHDVDLSIDTVALSNLEYDFDVVRNPRLHKRELQTHGVDVDLYLSKESHLRVDYKELSQFSKLINKVRVACPEHLLLLKLPALAERWESSHGEKDRRDVAKLMVLMHDDGWDEDILLPALDDSDLALLERVVKSNVFQQLAHRNAKRARRLRVKAKGFLEEVNDALEDD